MQQAQPKRGRKLVKSQSTKKIRARTEDPKKKSLKKQQADKIAYVGQGNNGKMIATYLQSINGWRILDKEVGKVSNDFQFKWVQTNADIQFNMFKDGQQMINHIPNHMILTSKYLCIQTMRDYENKYRNLTFTSAQFFPSSYRIDLTSESYSNEEDQFQKNESNGLWIIKPTFFNCGKGIKLCSNSKKLKQEMVKLKQIASQIKLGKGFIVNGIFTPNLKKCIIQKYITNPLLLEGRKFDIRCYVLIASTRPMLVLFQHGYLRLSVDKFTLDDLDDEKNKYKHLTNAAIQKKHPSFAQSKESTIWSMGQFEQYIKEHNHVTHEQITGIYTQMKKIFAHIIRCAADKFEKRLGLFELLGCDIMIDDKLKVYLIELNTNPALFLDTTVQSQVIPPIIFQTIDIVLQVNDDKNKPLEKLLSNSAKLKLGTWEVIHNEVSQSTNLGAKLQLSPGLMNQYQYFNLNQSIMQEEPQTNQAQQTSLNQILAVSHLGAKLTKIQLQQINLSKVIQICHELLDKGVPFRECSSYLQGLTVVYLKQYSMLKTDILQLQSSMMNKDNFIEMEKKDTPRRTKSKKPKIEKDAVQELQENSNNSIDNPRNIATGDRIQLEEQQRTPIDVNQLLRRQHSTDSKLSEEISIMQDVKSLEKQSLKELMQNRRIQRDQSDKSSNASSKSTPMVPRIVINNPDQFLEEVQPGFDQQSNNELAAIAEDESPEKMRHREIMKHLEQFGIRIQEQDLQKEGQEQNVTKVQKQRQRTAHVQMDEYDRDDNIEKYEANLQQFMRYQDRVDDLQLKMNILNMQPEFWKERDNLLDLINEFDQHLSTTDIHIQSHSKFHNGQMTTIDYSHNQQIQNDQSNYQYIEEFNDNFNVNKQPQVQEDHKAYTMIGQHLRQQFKQPIISDHEYFQCREQQGVNKSQAFYDLLVMGRIGTVNMQQNNGDLGRYAKISIKL